MFNYNHTKKKCFFKFIILDYFRYAYGLTLLENDNDLSDSSNFTLIKNSFSDTCVFILKPSRHVSQSVLIH